MFCPKCGTKNPDGAKFCSKCGATLGGSAAPAQSSGGSSETSVGMSANTAGLLCYVGLWISGIVFVVLEKKSKFVRFHAWQSIMTFGILTVLQLVLSTLLVHIGWASFSWGLIRAGTILGYIIGFATLALWIILMIQAGTGKMWKLPWIGNWAERQASK